MRQLESRSWETARCRQAREQIGFRLRTGCHNEVLLFLLGQFLYLEVKLGVCCLEFRMIVLEMLVFFEGDVEGCSGFLQLVFKLSYFPLVRLY